MTTRTDVPGRSRAGHRIRVFGHAVLFHLVRAPLYGVRVAFRGPWRTRTRTQVTEDRDR